MFTSGLPNRVARNWKKMNVIVMYAEEKERRVFQAQNLGDTISVEAVVMRAAGVGVKGLPLVVNLHAGVGGVSEPVVA
jgi:hypothetical protein